MVKLLLQNCSDHLICNNNENTLLHLAAEDGSEDTVNFMLDLGMDTNAKNKNLKTPILRASHYENWEIVKLLLEHGADH